MVLSVRHTRVVLPRLLRLKSVPCSFFYTAVELYGPQHFIAHAGNDHCGATISQHPPYPTSLRGAQALSSVLACAAGAAGNKHRAEGVRVPWAAADDVEGAAPTGAATSA